MSRGGRDVPSIWQNEGVAPVIIAEWNLFVARSPEEMAV